MVLCPTMYLYLSRAQTGNSPLHVVAGKGNYEALRAFLKIVELPDINCTNEVLLLKHLKGGNPRGFPVH